MLTLTSPVETRAHRWPAGAKLAGLALWTLALFGLPGPGWALAALGVVAAAAFVLDRRLGRAWAGLLGRLWPVALVLALWHVVSGTPGEGITVAARMLAAIGAANLVTMTTRLSDMQAVALWLARPLAPVVPPRVLALAFALAIRFVPVMLIRMAALGEAFRARSARRVGWRIAMPAVLVALDDAERVADALRARGGAG